MRTKEDKKDFVNETFSEVDLVREYWNDGTFFFVHEKIGLGGEVIVIHTEVPRIWWMYVSMKSKVVCLTH